MKKENKKVSKKTNNRNIIKISTIILLIILVSMIGFFGIYKQNKNQMSNIVKDYSYSMALNGARTVKLKLTDENGDEVKTEENYNKSKEIIEERLKSSGIEEYNVGLNTQNGEIFIEIPENLDTDKVVSNLKTIGKFEIKDSKTEDLLLDNSKIKSSKVLYNTTQSGTSVYLEIAFNKDGKNKLEEVSKTYVKDENNTTSENNTIEEVSENLTEDTTGNTTENTTTEEKSNEKQITMKIDDEEIMTTSFDEPITTGKIQLSVGKATTDKKTLEGYVSQAQNIATVLDSGNLPVKYEIEKNEYILSNINEKKIRYIVIAIAVLVVIGIISLVIKYKSKGLLAGILHIGLVALYLLLIRYANVIISIESIFGIAIVLILNFLFTSMLLNKIENNIKEKKENVVNKATKETYQKFFIRIIPICIMAIAFCFMKWIPMNSFGMVLFWGLLIIAVYNAVATRYLLKVFVNEK